MPVPWKKSKVSQSAADRINSSENGNSLVVENGFPTSLVDLFHKNRVKMKKSSNKKGQLGQEMVALPPVAPSSSVIMSNLNSSDSESTVGMSQKGPKKLVKTLKLKKKLSNLDLNSIKEKCSDKVASQEKEKCSTKLESPVNVTNEEESLVASKWKVFVAILKVFFVVVLAMGTNRFVVGVGMSAFSLFCFEFLGKYVYGLLRPRSNSTSTARSVSGSSVGKKGEILEIEDVDSDGSVSVRGCDLIDVPNADKQIVQSESDVDLVDVESTNVDHDKGLQSEERDSDKGVLEKKEDCKPELSDSKSKGSRRAKMKSKLKKLVSKKILKSKKKGSDSKSEEPALTQDNERKERAQGSEVCTSDDIGTDFLSDGTSESFEFLQTDMEASSASVVVAELGRKTEGTLKYWVLCLVVLGGLIGGRSLAFVFTLLCCLMWIIHKILYNASNGDSSF